MTAAPGAAQADEEWEIVRRWIGVAEAPAGPEIPKIVHRFWTGGPMREGAFRFLADAACARRHGWRLFLWWSREIEDIWDGGLDGGRPRLSDEDHARRDEQRDALAHEGYTLRAVEELYSTECRQPLSEAQVRQIQGAARVAAEHPDAGEEGVNVKCFSDIARLVYLREHGGLHLDVDIGLGDMDLERVYRHHDPEGWIPLLGALGRDTESAPEVAADLHAARQARRAGVVDRERVIRLAERALLGARAYNAVIATRPGTPHLGGALRALLAELAKSALDLPSGMSVQRTLLCGDDASDEALEKAARLAVPPYLTRLEQLTPESDRAPVMRGVGGPRAAEAPEDPAHTERAHSP